MARKTADKNWETATWEGARRAQLRAALRMSVRERLLAMEELCEIAQRLAAMPRAQGRTAKPAKRSGNAKPHSKTL